MKEQTDMYRKLKEYLQHHSPLCREMVERRPDPQQVTSFLTKGGRLIGKVSGLTIDSFHPAEDNSSVTVYTATSSFVVPTIKRECYITSFEDFIDLLIGEDVMVLESGRNVEDFDVEYCGKNGFACSYIEFNMRQVKRVNPDEFKEARLFQNSIQVYKQEYGIITIPIKLLR